MRLIFPRIALLASLWMVVSIGSVLADPLITLVPDRPSAVYQQGEPIAWQVTVSGDDASLIQGAAYFIKKGGGTVVGQGSLDFKQGPARIETSSNEPCTLLVEVTAPLDGRPPLVVRAGAAIDPDHVGPSMPRPDDFDAFWSGKLDELAAVPENPVLEPGESGKAGVDYWQVTLDNVAGAHIHGQLARPTHGDKFPALVIFQWAGVYPLQKNWVTDRAAEGWLVLEVMAHDLPIDQPKAFYDDQFQGPLKSYTSIGIDDRENSYFLHMFLGDHRALEYLSERPDWDGKTLVCSGTSQGGMQSFATAALDPKVTALMVLCPAGGDPTGGKAGRRPGWPDWVAHSAGHDADKVFETSRYFDPVNFASRIKCPALIALGLIDTDATPSSVFATANQLGGPKELLILPEADHHGSNNTHAPYYARSAVWRTALLKGLPVPPAP